MIYFIVGLQGPVARWCDAALQGLIALSTDRVAHLCFPSTGALPKFDVSSRVIDEAPLFLLRANADDLIVTALEPGERLNEVLKRSSAKFLLPLDNPRDVVAELCAQGNQALDAIEAVANCCPFFLEYALMPGAFTVRAHDLSNGGLSVLVALAAHFALAADEKALALLATQLPPPTEEKWQSMVPATATKLMEGALGAYAESFAGAELSDLNWHREHFRLAADVSRLPSAPIQLRNVGNGLCLVYGPYLRLPPGYWLARVMLGVSAEAAGQTLHINVFCGSILATTKFCPRTSGVFTVELDFACDEVTSQAVEIVIMVGRNSAPGEIAFGHVVMHPISLRRNVLPDTQDFDFRSVLDI